ncbi:MAG: right-handed parallel beta-helix repeat-containing protein, partial [Promethearchaeota archaeon]
SGTSNDPYVIENVTIDGQSSGSCITVQTSNVYFVIRNCHLFNAGTGLQDAGLKLFSADNGVVENCNISSNNEHGIYLYIDTDNVKIRNNVINSNLENGIGINPSTSTQSGHEYVNNEIKNNANGGISVSQNLVGAQILDNTFSGNSINLNLQTSSYLTIKGNTIVDGSSYGILGLIHHSVIEKNVFDNCATALHLYGVSATYASNYNDISKNVFTGNVEGIRLMNSAYTGNNTLWFNHLEGNSDHVDDEGTNYWDNGSIGNYWDDYAGVDGDNDGIGDTVYDVDATGGAPYDHFPLMITPAGPDNVLICGDGVNGHDWSWWMARSWWLSGSGSQSDPYIIENLEIDAGGSGSCLRIWDDSTNYFSVQNCIFTGSGTGSGSYEAGLMLNNTAHGSVINNTCNGNGDPGIYLRFCNDTVVQGNDASSNSVGILNSRGNNNTFISNTINGNSLCGIRIWRGEDILIQNNTITNHAGTNDVGIYLYLGIDNVVTVTGNRIQNNYHGIRMWGESNDIIHNNTITGNYNGIQMYIFDSSGGTYFNITHNKIQGNTHYGIDFYDSSAGRNFTNIFGNNFTGNAQHVHKASSTNYTIWFDNGVYGNSWDGYAGVDADDDFIGDTPYAVPGMAGYFDNLPLFDDGDDLYPVISFISPGNNSEHVDPVDIHVQFSDAYGIDSMWFELVGISSNQTLNATTTFININSTTWDQVDPGETLLIRVYANDTSGKLVVSNFTLMKETTTTSPPPFLLLLILIAIAAGAGIGILAYLKLKKKKKGREEAPKERDEKEEIPKQTK